MVQDEQHDDHAYFQRLDDERWHTDPIRDICFEMRRVSSLESGKFGPRVQTSVSAL
jgi:hypothetical protein